MTREKAIEQLRELNNDGDVEANHSTADAILCELLDSLGYADVIAEWTKIRKWYA